jgi:hypothetical protein
MWGLCDALDLYNMYIYNKHRRSGYVRSDLHNTRPGLNVESMQHDYSRLGLRSARTGSGRLA